jgi:uncharacterized protein (TIGR04222 family)
MNDEHVELWDRIRAFDFEDPASSLTFTRRLARENRWSLDHARRVVEEYKRFALLAMFAGHPVTPSDAVDQAWHLHLVYTRSYWDDFCGEVLRKPLHHGPTRGGQAESAKYHDWYARTLDSYLRIFGHEPPADVWPPAAVRFGRDLHFTRINTETHWVVPRPRWLVQRAIEGPARAFRGGIQVPRFAIPACLVGAALIVVGCVAPVGGGGRRVGDLAGMTGVEFLWFYIPLAVIAVLASLWMRHRLRLRASQVDDAFDDGPPIDPAKLNPYEAALLVHGPKRNILTRVALVRLAGAGEIEFVGNDSIRRSDGRRAALGTFDSFEQIILGEAAAWSISLSRIDGVVSGSPHADRVEATLRKWGAVIPPEAGRAIRFLPALLLAAVIALGLWRIQLGLNRGRPVGFLVLTCLGLGLAAATHVLLRPWRTRKGQNLMRSLRRDVAPAVGSADPRSAALAFAILGISALPSTDAYATLREAFKPPAGGEGGCGGGGCGGGGGGGGCGGGGCGGCGG